MLHSPFRAVIVEDSPHEAALLEALLSKFSQIKIIGQAREVNEGAELIRTQKPDLVFLDIEIKGGDGFELLDRLGDFEPRPAVIFTTGFNDYAIQAIRHSALDYLLKPVDPAELGQALKKFFDRQGEPPTREQWQQLVSNMNPGQKIKINTHNGFTLIHPDEIVYCEADGNYTDLYLNNGNRLATSFNLGRIEELLPPGRFFRIHRSVTINLQYLTSVNRQKKRCYLTVHGKQLEFCMPVLKIRELERGW